jgi:3-oxoacyl-[acyl-carrier protein] reductase
MDKINKTALITGASRGIGRSTAAAFARSGYNLVINCAKSQALLASLRSELESLYHVTVSESVGDVGDPAYVDDLFHMAEERFGGIDVLINNAGISHIGLLSDMTLDEWDRIVRTDLTSVFLTSRRAIPSMVRQKSGSIVNISSVWGNCGASCEVAYSACKGGVNAFTKALAKELAPSGITVNAIACGVIDTQMNACFSDDEKQALIDEIPAGRFGQPDEVAALVLQLAGRNKYLTGQIITLDGGWI